MVNSGNSDYVNSFNDIAEASNVAKIASRAEEFEQRLLQIQQHQTEQPFIDIDALSPSNKNLSVAPAHVVSVTDERRFETGIRNSSSPSMTEPAYMVPAEKRASLIAVMPRGARFQLDPFVLLSLPLGSSVEGEVRSLLEAGLRRRSSSRSSATSRDRLRSPAGRCSPVVVIPCRGG